MEQSSASDLTRHDAISCFLCVREVNSIKDPAGASVIVGVSSDSYIS